MNTTKHTSLLVIGGGPGGYSAAFRAADLGLEVTMVDTEENPGGVCLYRGCIPTKTLLHAAKVIADSRSAEQFGVTFNDVRIDTGKVDAFKNDVVTKLTGGLGQLRKLRRISFIRGKARFIDSGSVQIDTAEGTPQTLSFGQAILATGSFPVRLPFEPKSDRIVDSTGALDIRKIPGTLLVIGGSYIGLEFATVYNELGSRVTVVEMLPDLLPLADRDMVTVLEKHLTQKLAAIHKATKVTEIKETDGGLSVALQHPDGRTSTETFEKVLVAVGRKPLTRDLGLEQTSVELDAAGFVKVDPQRRTTDPKIFAIGDAAGQPMLAHKATHEGMVAAEVIAGKNRAFDPKAIPSVVYTNPEVVWCGLSETEAEQQNHAVKVLKFPWLASGRAMTLKRTDGLTKLIADADTGRLLGFGIVGESAGEMAAEGVLAIEMGATAEDLAQTIHPHPTLSETVMEAAEGFSGQSTHILRGKK